MTITVYVDLGSPLTLLVHQRAARLHDAGIATVRLRPVVPAGLPLTGSPDDPTFAALLARAAEWALPGELRPATPRVRSHPGAMTAAYAEAIADGTADALLDAFMTALWRDGYELSDAASVRRHVAAVTSRPAIGVAPRVALATPVVALGSADPSVVMRRCGGTITPAGAPISTVGTRRMATWADQWARRGRAPLPLVLSPLGEAFPGRAGLDYLAGLLPARPRELVTEHAALRDRLAGAVAGLAAASADGIAFGASRRSLLTVLRHDLVDRIGDEDRHLLAPRVSVGEAARLRRDHARLRAGVLALERADGRAAAITAARDLLTQVDRHLRREDEVLPRLVAAAAGRAGRDDHDLPGEPSS